MSKFMSVFAKKLKYCATLWKSDKWFRKGRFHPKRHEIVFPALKYSIINACVAELSLCPQECLSRTRYLRVWV